MTRLGWIILVAVLVAIGLFASMLSFGPVPGGGITPRITADVPSTDAAPGTLVVPVKGYPAASLRDSWGDERAGGARAHRGTDLMATAGTPVIAAAAGRVEKLFDSDAGGTTLYVRSHDRRWSYYYAHLAGYVPGLREGMRVRAGDPLGYVGDTGNAGIGNAHLHFAMSRMGHDDRWWQGEAVNPYPLLAGSDASR